MMLFTLLESENICITSEELSPSIYLAKRDSDLLFSRRSKPKAKIVLQKVSDKIAIAFTSRINVNLPENLYIIYGLFFLPALCSFS